LAVADAAKPDTDAATNRRQLAPVIDAREAFRLLAYHWQFVLECLRPRDRFRLRWGQLLGGLCLLGLHLDGIFHGFWLDRFWFLDHRFHDSLLDWLHDRQRVCLFLECLEPCLFLNLFLHVKKLLFFFAEFFLLLVLLYGLLLHELTQLFLFLLYLAFLIGHLGPAPFDLRLLGHERLFMELYFLIFHLLDTLTFLHFAHLDCFPDHLFLLVHELLALVLLLLADFKGLLDHLFFFLGLNRLCQLNDFLEVLLHVCGWLLLLLLGCWLRLLILLRCSRARSGRFRLLLLHQFHCLRVKFLVTLDHELLECQEIFNSHDLINNFLVKRILCRSVACFDKLLVRDAEFGHQLLQQVLHYFLEILQN